jgi:hypothetical protein
MRIVASLMLLTCSCSWLFQTRPPEIGSNAPYPVQCTTSDAAPVLDTIAGIFWTGTAIGVLAGDCNGSNCDTGAKVGAAALSGGIALAYYLSAGSGFQLTKRCQKLRETSSSCAGGDERSCAILNWDPRKAPHIEEVIRRPPPPKPAGSCDHDSDCDHSACIDGYCR